MNPIQQLVIGLALASGASATMTFTDPGAGPDPGLPLAIPDHDASGILRSLAVTGLDANTRYSVDVSLNIQATVTGYGGYVGDLYAYLAHQASPGGEYRMTVLLNRPGRSTSLLSGYGDTGLNITLSDSADHEIHTYQTQADYALDGVGALTGTWQPDRRVTSPVTVLDTDARSTPAFDDLVHGMTNPNPNGYWYLFISDMETGATMQLNSWSVSFSEVSAVPEPANALTLAGLLSSAMLLRTRRRKRVA